MGEGWSAVATSHEVLRLYSSTGIPLALVSLKGAVVAMVGYIHQLAGRRMSVCVCMCVCVFFFFFVCMNVCMYVHTRECFFV